MNFLNVSQSFPKMIGPWTAEPLQSAPGEYLRRMSAVAPGGWKRVLRAWKEGGSETSGSRFQGLASAGAAPFIRVIQVRGIEAGFEFQSTRHEN